MKIGKNLLRLAGNLSLAIYLLFTLISYFFYPDSFTPMTNWLSDLGNPKGNIVGSFFYNAGGILTSLMLILFYLRLRQLPTVKRTARILLSIAWAAGICASLALITSSAFPLGAYTKIHSTASSVMYFAITYFEAFSATVILMQPGFNKALGIYGLLAAVETCIFGFLNDVFLGEWITVGAFIVYILFIVNSPRFGIKDTKKTIMGV